MAAKATPATSYRIVSTVFLAAAGALVAYVFVGLSHFTHYMGEYSDERMVLFDNGVYPFAWGVLLLIGQLARLHYRRAVASQSVFPDAGLLNELRVIAGVLLVLALADGAIAAGLQRIAQGLPNRQR